MEVGRRG